MSATDFRRFAAWAGAQAKPPRPADVRREFGVSNPTACRWLQQLLGPARARRTARYAGSHIEAVFDHLARCAEPVPVSEVAGALAIEPTIAMHALQNLYEAGRVLRNTHVKPFTYRLPDRALNLLPPPATRAGTLTPSVGQVLVAPLRHAA